MHQRPATESQQRLTLARRHQWAVEAVLLLGVLQALFEARLELQRCHRYAVEKQSEIESALIAVRAVDQLWHHPQPVLGITLDELWVKVMVRLESSHCQPVPSVLYLMTE